MLLLWISAAWAQPPTFVVVGHTGTTPDTATKQELAYIFLKKRTTWSTGYKAKPVDQRTKTAIRTAFSTQVLGKSVNAVTSYWQGQVFGGKSSPPEELASDEDVTAYVSKTPGAVGYISPASITPSVTVIAIVSSKG